MNAVQTVPFHGLSLSAVLVNGAPFVAIRPICDALGIDYEGQRQRIKRDPLLSSNTCVMKAVARDGKMRAALFLALDHLNGWLFGVDVARVRAELRERMNWYRRECCAVLAQHFGLAGDNAAALREQLRQAEAAEGKSFALARVASRAMSRRRREKPRLLATIAGLKEVVQLVLPLEGDAA